MTKDTSGTAFPSAIVVGELAESSGGLTKREWFAGQALAGLLAVSDRETLEARMAMKPADARRALAVVCFAMADAMLKAGMG